MLKKPADAVAQGARKDEIISRDAKADPAGPHVEWEPLSSSGSSFQTHTLVIETPHTAAFGMTRGAKWFCGLLTFIGAAVLVAWAYHVLRGETWSFAETDWGPLLFGAIFAGIGFGMWSFMGPPVTFDKRSGYFWKGRTRPTGAFEPDKLKNAARLENIHALQLLKKIVQSSRGDDRRASSFPCYELNLVLEDGKRINAVGHGNHAAMKKDAEQLAEFLQKPLWDASSGQQKSHANEHNTET